MANPRRSVKWKIITATTVVIFLLTVTLLTGRERNRLTFFETAVHTIIAPVQNLAGSAARRTAEIVETIQKYRLLEEENRLLKEELAYLESVQVQLKELQKENYRLRELLEFKAQTQYTLLPAEVIARSPERWFEMLTINKGSSHGVEKGMPVVTHLGLVGNIYSVSPYSSRVLLLTDPQRGVSSMVQRSRDPGVVVGV
ncbi:MAG TPA: rod shape-determining protein MreC, partial [Firmicutes bacterium]|nr:rod shape-determining protein MreC [Bacillota bacterium]